MHIVNLFQRHWGFISTGMGCSVLVSLSYCKHFWTLILRACSCEYALNPLILQSRKNYSEHHWIAFKLKCILKTRTEIESWDCYHIQQVPNIFLNLCNILIIHLMSKIQLCYESLVVQYILHLGCLAFHEKLRTYFSQKA